jgi:bifunctional polynucleotide phosphatase/kinase
VKSYSELKDTVFKPLPDGTTEIVLLVGPPAVGKSSISKNQFSNYTRVNQDTLKTKAKCFQVARDSLGSGKSVIVDNTNSSQDTRLEWIAIAKSLCIVRICYLYHG